MLKSVFRPRLRVLVATAAAALTAATTTAVVLFEQPAANALSFNPAPANIYHAPVSTMGLAALDNLQGRLSGEINDHANGGGGAATPASGSSPIPLAAGMSSITLPSGTTRFITDSSYMPQSETTVAVDASGTVLGGYNDSRYFFCPVFQATNAVAANCPSGWTYSLSGFTVSTDGGKSVATTATTSSGAYDIPSVLVPGQHRPGPTSLLISYGDPGVATIPNVAGGQFYFSSLAFSPTTQANGIELAVSNSTLTSSPASCITPQSDPISNACWTSTLVSGNLVPQAKSFADKPMIAVDTDQASPYYRDAYVGWDEFLADGTSASYLARCTPTLSCTMLSGGRVPPVSAPDQFAADTTPAVDSNGNLYVSWCNFGTATTLMPITCKVRVSTDGGTSWSAPTQILTLDETTSTGGGLDGYATEQFRTANIPSFTVGAAPGGSTNLYFTIDACKAGDYFDFLGENVLPGNCGASAVLFTQSTYSPAAGIGSFAPPTDLSSAAPNAITAQPWVTADPAKPGHVDVVYYTTQYDTTYNHLIDVVLQSSGDGGSTWSTPTRLTSTSIEPDSDPAYFDYLSTFGGAFLVPQFGDYFQATVHDGTLWTLYSATYTAELGTLQTDPYLAVTSG